MTTSQTWVRTYQEIWPFDWQTPARRIGGFLCFRGQKLVCLEIAILHRLHYPRPDCSASLKRRERKTNQSNVGHFFNPAAKKIKKHICIDVWRSRVLVIAAKASVTRLRRGALVCLQRCKLVKDAAASLWIFDKRRRRNWETN